MRGFQAPGVRNIPTESQARFQSLSRHRRVKLAKVANTTLVKADQWARGDGAAPEVASALEGALAKLGAKK